MEFSSSTRNLIGAVVVLALTAAPALAQKDRIAGQIDSRRMVVLKGNVHPNAQPQFDQGPVDPAMKLNYVTLTLNSSASQQADLDQLLVDQQDPFSPNYHKWLTPEQYADRFGVSPADIAKLVAWMNSVGFDVITVARGRKWIAFNATAQQIQTALQTQIHYYRVDGELHFANSTEPSIPAALQQLVNGFLGLNDFRPKPRPRARIISQDVASLSAGPLFTSNSGGHFLAPGDLATIYNINPLYNNGVDGTGLKMVVAGQTGVYIQDIRQFRSGFGLSANDPEFVLVPGSTNPGVTADQDEANLDLEWSGAIARNAQIQFVYSTNVETSVQYAIDQNLAPVISYSYDICEPLASSSFAGAIQPFAQQANAQGITWLASTGDAGAAGCDRQGQAAQATKGIAVSLPASIPEVTAVGGTEFNEGNGSYWNNTNSNNGGGSALSYIPEMAWNESGSGGLASTGGGFSTFFAKPSWQTGPGVSSTNARAVPDVSLTAASGHDGYIVVLNGSVSVIGGTSASTPAFAGLVVLINQYLNSNGLGNINPNLYRIAQSTTGIFHDVTIGNNIVPCAPASPNCSTGSFGYSAGPGYDPVTGLGSVDGFKLASGWNTSIISTTTTVTASSLNVALNGSAQLTATVKPVGSSGTPTGTVSFIFKGTSLGATTLSNSGTASVTVYGSQLPTGSDVITANYSGSNSFNASSGSVTINVSVPSGSSAVIPTANPNPVYQQQTDADGYSWFLTLRLTEVAGVATSFTGFSFNGGDYSSAITSFFGSSSIPALGTLSAAVRIKALTVPTIGVFGFSGVDGSGNKWSQQLSVPFFGLQQTASVQLVGLPGTVVQNIQASDPTCQWLQNLGLQEQNGHTVYLTRFLAGGFDLSDMIADFFGDSILPGYGSLLGGVCWDLNSSPQTLSYEVDGIDDVGNAIVATQSTLFTGPAANLTSLSVSQDHLLFTSVNSVQSGSGQINVSLGRGLQWTVSAFPSNRTTSWLVVSPLSGTGAGTVNIVTNPSGLADGVYQATLVFQAVDGLPQFINVPITLVVGKPNVTTIINGASLVPTGLSPGLIFTLKGTGLGPQSFQTLQLDDNGNVATELAGVQVLVAGTPAPLLYVQAGQINAVAPYEIANRVSAPVNVQVISNGVTGNVVGEVGARAAPAIFSYPYGSTQGAIRNQDESVNGPGNPAGKGSIVSIYATGEGQTNPPGIDGRIANDSLANLPRPVAPFSISIGGVQAVYTYAGTTPQSFAGFFQVNAVIPSNVPSGPNQVILTVGDASSPPLTVVVK